jgi:ABC-type branched-subunit amino acid transport system ATPase component
MLEIKHVAKNFGGLKALSNISVSVKPREFVGLIGPNGSGKTTLLNCVSGLYTPDSGSIRFGESVISRLRPHKIYRLGIGRTFQISKVFNRLTVLENLRVPALTEGKMNRREINERSMDILKELNLGEHGNSAAESLSGGQKKLLEIGMIMMTDAQFLLLDEPFGGVHPELKKQLEDYLCGLNKAGKTIILVSHEMPSVFRICKRLVVLNQGMLVTDGSPEAVRLDERVVNAYLGGKYET